MEAGVLPVDENAAISACKDDDASVISEQQAFILTSVGEDSIKQEYEVERFDTIASAGLGSDTGVIVDTTRGYV